MKEKKQRFLMGMKWGIPVVLGFIPVGIAYAIMARQAGFTVLETIFMSVSVFAGASQMMAVGMYAQGAGIIAIIIATFVINLRHTIMSTCVFNRLRGAGTGAKMLASFGTTDESFAIFTSESEDKISIQAFFGLFLVTYSSWIAGTAIGAFASDLLPASVSAAFGIALYAMFIGIMFPAISKNLRLALLVLITAVVNSVLCIWLDSSWALIISTLGCAFVGIFFVDTEEKKNE